MFDFFKPKQTKYYKAPIIEYPTLYAEMAKQAHLLIAGQTGSGKSVTLNGIIYILLQHTPNKIQFIMIDPKKTELCKYKKIPHCLEYAAQNDEIVHALTYGRNIMQARFVEMAARGETELTNGPDIYIIIDELAQITLNLKKQAVPLLQEILQLGRAAHIHIIACSQNPIIQVIPTVLRVNFTGVIGLKTMTKQQSRNIIGCNGCESLPAPRIAHKAMGYYLDGCTMELYNMPMVADIQLQKVVNYWSDENQYIVYKTA